MVLPPIGLSPEQHPIVVWPTVHREEGERERERERERGGRERRERERGRGLILRVQMCTCMYLSADGNRLKVLYNDEVAGSCFEPSISYT